MIPFLISISLLTIVDGSMRCGKCFCTGQTIICRSVITLNTDHFPNRDKVRLLDLRGSVGEVDFENISTMFVNLEVVDLRDRICEKGFTLHFSFKVVSDCVTSTSTRPNITQSLTRRIPKLKINYLPTTDPTTSNQMVTTDSVSDNTTHLNITENFVVAVGVTSSILILLPIIITFICCCVCDRSKTTMNNIPQKRFGVGSELRKRHFATEIPLNTLPLNTEVETLSADSVVLFKQD